MISTDEVAGTVGDAGILGILDPVLAFGGVGPGLIAAILAFGIGGFRPLIVIFGLLENLGTAVLGTFMLIFAIVFLLKIPDR
jgi:hypothetical protein